MNGYRPGDWLESNDTDEREPELYAFSQHRPSAAGCVFLVALLAGCVALALLLTQTTGGIW